MQLTVYYVGFLVSFTDDFTHSIMSLRLEFLSKLKPPKKLKTKYSAGCAIWRHFRNKEHPGQKNIFWVLQTSKLLVQIRECHNVFTHQIHVVSNTVARQKQPKKFVSKKLTKTNWSDKTNSRRLPFKLWRQVVVVATSRSESGDE